MHKTTIPARIYGRGIVLRHSRRCIGYEPPHHDCSCIPTFQAWVYVHGRKRKRAFQTERAALQWRIDQLRKLYGTSAASGGRLDQGYSLLRKTCQEIDAARVGLPRHRAASIHRVLDALYVAEDALLHAMREI